MEIIPVLPAVLNIALTKMSEGDSATIYVPSPYGFQEVGYQNVPPNTVIKYNVKFEDILLLSEDLDKIDQYIENKSWTTEIDSIYGLRYVIHQPGDQEVPVEIGDFISLDYTGLLLDDSEFDSSTETAPLQLYLGQEGYRMIIGFEIGLTYLYDKDSATVFIPSIYAYGENGSGDVIPPKCSIGLWNKCPKRHETILMKMSICFATNNLNKLREIKNKLGKAYDIISLSALGHNWELPETHDTLEENSLEKAQFIYDKYQVDCFADDTGLIVEALNGEPGVKSARYAGPAKNSEDNMNLLLRKLENSKDRKAKFITVISLIIKGKVHQFTGEIEGVIAHQKMGNQGFGYDPIFIPEGWQKNIR